MESIDANLARRSFSQLLNRVEKGHSIIITKGGKPIARLIPEKSVSEVLSVEECIAGLLEFRESHPMSLSEIRGLIEEGRKH